MSKPKRKVYQQAIVLPENRACPFCNRELVTNKASVLLHIPGPPVQRKIIGSDLLFCEKCQMHFVSSLKDEEFWTVYGGRVIRLPQNRMKNAQTARYGMFKPVDGKKQRPSLGETFKRKGINLGVAAEAIRASQVKTEIQIAGTKHELFDPSRFNWKNVIPNVFVFSGELSICPKCGERELRPYSFPALIKKQNRCVKIDGFACYHCNAAFSSKARLLNELERLRDTEMGYQLRRDFYLPEDEVESRQKQFLSSDTAYCQAALYAPEDVRIYTLERVRRNCDGQQTVHYTSDEGLAMLTALYLSETKVELDGKTFVIGSCAYAKSKDKIFLSPNDTVEVTTRKGGGYYSADEETEQLDALVFCHNSRRLEVLPVSFDKKTGEYFVDSAVLRGFYQKHGIPFVKYSQKIRNELVPLRDESYLHALGYNVGEQAGLNDDQRQRILADAADAGMPIQDIRRMLDFLINLNRNKDGLRTACEKWEEDKEFISNYKINQDNFVFAGKVRGIKQLG